MYQSRQFIPHDSPVEIPGCMYKMKNILATNLTENKSNTGEKLDILQQSDHNSEMATLMNQQENIMKKLEELKQQMLNLKNILKTQDIPNGLCMNTDVTMPSEEYLGKSGKLHEFVINVNPLNPPYSLLLLKKIWAKSVKIVVKSYVHSTVLNVPKPALDFIEILNQCEPSNSPVYVLIRLIWKNVDKKLGFLSSNNTSIQGEVNFLRHLSRLGPKQLNYEQLKNPCDVDSVMDTCHLFIKSRTKSEQQACLQALNAKLGKKQWLCDSNISIADIAAYSAIKQASNNDINVNLTKWMKLCEQM